MNKYIKAAIALTCVAFFVVPVRAENYTIPVDNGGNVPADISLVGCDVLVATATVALGGAAAVGSTVPVVLYGYSVSSDVGTNFAMLRDTNTLNNSSNIKLTLYPDGGTSTSTGTWAQTTHTRLPVPVLFRNGLSIDLHAAPTGATAATGQSRGRWMFYIRYQQSNGTPGKPPTFVVDNQGVN